MSRPPSSKNPIFWFIPALLTGVLVLSALCLFLIRGQARSEESLLREQERQGLDHAQQQFRLEIEAQWQKAFQTFPSSSEAYTDLRRWDQQLDESTFGFCLDDSGLLLYPALQTFSPAQPKIDEVRQALATLFPTSGPLDSVAAGKRESQDDRGEDTLRRMLLAEEKRDRENALRLALTLLSNSGNIGPNPRFPAQLPATAVLLELEEFSERTMPRQAALVDRWLEIFEQGLLPLSPKALPWLKRIQEQCRRRNEAESWLQRERRIFRQVRQTQWAEKFLPRLNLLLRRHLYNPDRAELAVQVLNSDPAEDPFLILCRFQNTPAIRLIGLAVDLESFCRRFETSMDQTDSRLNDVVIRIARQEFSTAETKPLRGGTGAPGPGSSLQTSQPPSSVSQKDTPTPLVEKRILDRWAPQFTVEATPRDFPAFERRALRKNLLYLTLLALTIATCVLVLFLGNRALQEQQRLSKLRTDFLTNISHELRTPLTAIRLHAETLERQLPKTSPIAAASIETIVGEVDRLSLLINDVLEFTRVENDKKRYLWVAVDLVPVIHESLQLFSQQLADLGFEVSLDLPESLILQRADRAALKQCAVNLISNCVKFSPQEKHLSVRLAIDGGQARWETEDRGIGVEPEDQPYVFEKFYRGTHLDPAFSGTGLGLTLCKAFIEAHGGTIAWEEPSSGVGSLFVIRIPID